MQKFIQCVTVTGADDSTAFSDIQETAQRFPFVEFGILVSRNHSGANRFPSQNWLTVLAHSGLHETVNFSCHFCGEYVRMFAAGKNPLDVLRQEVPAIPQGLFKRIQINTHGYKTYGDFFPPRECVEDLESQGVTVILQHDDANSNFIEYIATRCANVVALCDLSHGAGVLPDAWPSADVFPCPVGYAGGLSPDNVAAQIEAILAAGGGKTGMWIDAETMLRSNGDVLFDFDKVEAFLQASAPYIVGGAS